jgi:mannose/cellobiose epimerase-like protein (N-acyl-D-glucosamine 2-epimerase family)
MPPQLAAAHVALRHWLVGHAYDLWWLRGADRDRGGFHVRLRQDATPTGEPRRARLHPRQVYAYSRAARLGWPGPAAAAVTHGIEFFLAHYARPDGLFRSLVTPDGAPLGWRAARSARRAL